MFDELINYFRGRKVVILGFGREGESTYRFLRKVLPDQEIAIADARDLGSTDLASDSKVKLICGDNYLRDLQDYDIIMKAPGISLAKVNTSAYVDKITSQLELTLKFLDLETIGITGTKGKSTTSSLVYQILQDQNVPSLLLGNIGTPIFEHFDELRPGMAVVLEISSHQLEFCQYSPHVAVLLNIYEEHLDHYASYLKYAEAKCNIFRHQTAQDFFFYNADNRMLQQLVQNPPAHTYRISLQGNDAEIRLVDGKIYFGDEVIYDVNSPRQLPGEYNLYNIAFALGIARILNLDLSKATTTIAHFQTLHHRLEFVGKYDGVKYYDNSIGTVPMATIAAVQALGDVDTLIIGGMDRGVDQTPLVDFLQDSEVNNIICMPDTGYVVAQSLGDKARIAEDLETAVKLAQKFTLKGKSCLLSPAAASYGVFKNFEEKGDRYQELVRRSVL